MCAAAAAMAAVAVSRTTSHAGPHQPWRTSPENFPWQNSPENFPWRTSPENFPWQNSPEKSVTALICHSLELSACHQKKSHAFAYITYIYTVYRDNPPPGIDLLVFSPFALWHLFPSTSSSSLHHTCASQRDRLVSVFTIYSMA